MGVVKRVRDIGNQRTYKVFRPTDQTQVIDRETGEFKTQKTIGQRKKEEQDN